MPFPAGWMTCECLSYTKKVSETQELLSAICVSVLRPLSSALGSLAMKERRPKGKTAASDPPVEAHALRRPPLVEEGRLPFVRCLPLLPASCQLRSGGRASHVLGILPNRRQQRQEGQAETVVCVCVCVIDQEEKEEGTVNAHLGVSISTSTSISTTKRMLCHTSPLRSQRQATISSGRNCISRR